MSQTASSAGPGRRPSWRTLALLAAVAVAGGGFWLRGCLAARRPVPILLVTPPPEAEAEMSHYQARAIALLVQDGLETLPQGAVTVASTMPARPEELKPGERWLLVRLLPCRRQERLGLVLEWAWSARLAQGSTAWTRTELPLGPPELVLPAAIASLPLGVDPVPLKALYPGSGKGVWSLVQANTFRLQNLELPAAEEMARALVQQEPGCAEAWWLLGNLQYRALLSEPSRNQPGTLQATADCFRRGEELLPGHPRSAFLRAQLLTNSGSHREALEVLRDGLAAHPRSPLLLSGLVYSARNAGLLQVAKRAADLRDRWAFQAFQPVALDVLFLYLNDWPRFEITLRDQPGHLRNTIQRFYRGYLAVLRNRRAEALESFQAAESVPQGYPNYIRLARAYRLALEGSRSAAMAEFRALDRERLGLRVPDGEFTHRLAEGCALAGDYDAAMELAERAFGQGFGATLWYERSPFLEPLRSSPRWTTLLQHLRERQRMLEDRFPAGGRFPPG